jgi:hypothetical protein
MLLPGSGDRYKTVKATESKTTHSEEENIFYTDSKQTQITYSGLSRFARTRLEYTLVHNDVHFMMPFYFQSGIPIRRAVYTLTAPKSVNIGYRLSGLHTDRIAFKKEEGRNEVTYTWMVEDMPGANSYNNAPSAAHFIPHLIVYVKSYKAPRADTETVVLSSVGDLYKYFYAFVSNVNTGTDEAMNRVVDDIVHKASAPRDRAAQIYKWVQEHIRYVAYEDSLGGYIPRPATMVFSRRFGDCKDMTSLLVAMCRRAGLTTCFTWIGTRDIPYRYEDVPLPMADNHMICAVKLDNEWVLMDGTDRVIPFGTPPSHLQGKEALIGVDENNYKILTVPVIAPDRNSVTDSTMLNIAGNTLEGDISAHYTGYGAWNIASLMQYSNEKEKDKVLRGLTSRGSNNYMAKATRFLPAENEARACAITSNFSLPDYVRQIGDETYVNLNLQRSYDDEYVDKSRREVPIEYNYKQHLRQIVRLKIPQGHKATYLPPDKSDGEAGLWSYKLHYEQRDAEVWLIKEFNLDALQVTPDQFAAHNRLVESLRKEYKESVVLSNKQ